MVNQYKEKIRRFDFTVKIVILDDEPEFSKILDKKIKAYCARKDLMYDCQIFSSSKTLLEDDLSSIQVSSVMLLLITVFLEPSVEQLPPIITLILNAVLFADILRCSPLYPQCVHFGENEKNANNQKKKVVIYIIWFFNIIFCECPIVLPERYSSAVCQPVSGSSASAAGSLKITPESSVVMRPYSPGVPSSSAI